MRHSRRPILYLDTNVILDAALERDDESSSVIRRADTHGWQCITSRFTFAEMLDTLQKEKKMEVSRPLSLRQLNRIYDKLDSLLEEDYAFIQFERPVHPDFWDNVEWIAGMSNVRARDAIHFATAFGSLCDLIVTQDGSLRKAVEMVPVRLRVPTISSRQLDRGLRDAGFKIEEDGQALRA